MKFPVIKRLAPLAAALCLVLAAAPLVAASAQSRTQKTEKPAGDGKKNGRPGPMTEEERKKAEEEKQRAEEEKNAIIDPNVEKIETKLVNVEAVVYNKKTGQIMSGLKKENFAIFENGVKQNISNFAEPESPITVTLVVEYSKWSEVFGSAAGGVWEPGAYEVVKPVAYFLSKFIRPPNDYASVIAFDLRPTPITDFTNDPNRLRQTVDLLFRNQPAFRDNNLWDALKLALVGGRADSVVLENSKEEKSDYAGLVDVKAKRKAIILVASGIDTFSRTNYDQIRHIIQESGVPIYVISTGNLFCKKYCDYLDPTSVMPGVPDRMSFLQAQNAMNTIAKESGGSHYPMTFEAEIPGILTNINSLLRSQYSLSYDLDEKHEIGKKYKLEVKVDVDGDGVYDDKAYVVQHKPYFAMPNPAAKKDNKKN
jgi:Ca-activated chloride channel family protein